MTAKKFAVFGTGFWAQFQLAAWKEVEGAECVALYNRTKSKAIALGERFGITSVYDDPEELLARETVDFIDIITDVDTHERLVTLGASHGTSIICQKPMAPSLEACSRMVTECEESGSLLLIHENWRWQAPIRQLSRVLSSGQIGTPYRARIEMTTGFSVFDNQPFLKTLEQFVLTDIGSHILDTARFLFGDAARLYCETQRIHTDIAGEDVATVVLTMKNGMTVICQMAYAGTPKEFDRFPETYIVVEGSQGTAELGPDYTVKTTTSAGTHSKRYPPAAYPWADPAYALVHSSIVDCNRNLLAAINGQATAETNATDNFKTMQLVYGSYESARLGKALDID
jgi:predicted dehydrogenase